MISSMTGFGEGTASKGNITAEVEVKSLNSRYLDLSVKLPKTLSHKEYEIREKIKGKVARGKVVISVNIISDLAEDSELAFNKDSVRYVVKMLEEIKTLAGSKEEISLQHILTFQNAIFNEESDNSDEQFFLVNQALDRALSNMDLMKKREGEALRKDLIERLSAIENSLDEIQNSARNSIKDYFTKVSERASELFSELNAYDERLKMELALLTEKYDITEECVRLRTHIDLFRETLNNNGEAGRKLNFVSQEMNREANTINSKTISSVIAHHGIIIKEELEKIREQIQNIE